MKHFLLLIFGACIGIGLSAQQIWKLDSGHSNIRFEAQWQDFSIRTGEFKTFSGTAMLDSLNDFTDAVFELSVDPNSIDVVADKLSDVLKGDKFLDTENYPEMRFTSTGAIRKSDSTYVSTGLLLVHGVEKEQEVFIRYKGKKQGRKSEIFGIEVTLQLNRSDFGLEWGSPRLGEKVKVVGHFLYLEEAEEL